MNKLFKSIVCISIIGIILTGFTGCGLLSDTEDSSTESTENVLKSADGKLQLSIPSDWKEDKELEASASIQASNRGKEKYVIVLSTPTEDFAKGTKLADVAKIAKEGVLTSVKNATSSDFEDITINGIPGKAFDVKGEVNNLNVRYYIAILKSENYVHRIVTWTLASKYDENIPEMKKVIESFKEIK